MSETKNTSEILHSQVNIRRVVLGCLLSGAIGLTSGCGGGGSGSDSVGAESESAAQVEGSIPVESVGNSETTTPKPIIDSGVVPSDGSTSTNETEGQVQTQGSARLSWTPPAQRVDGDALAISELGGYRIYYGPATNPTANVVEISDPYTTQYTINGLSAASYSFSVTAYDSNGRESALSNSLSKTIN